MSTAGSREAHALGSFAQGNARSMNTDSAEYREHTHTHMTLCSRTHLPPTRSSGFLRRWHRRTGSVVLTAKLIAGYDAGGERRKPGQDGPDAAGVLDLDPGPRWALPLDHPAGPDLAGGPARERWGRAGRCGPGRQGEGGCGCPELPSPYSGITLSEEGGQGERTRTRRSARQRIHD